MLPRSNASRSPHPLATSPDLASKSEGAESSVAGSSLRAHGLWPARLLCPQDPPGKNPGVGCHSLLQGIFQTQGLNLGLSQPRQSLHHLSQDLAWKALPDLASASLCFHFSPRSTPHTGENSLLFTTHKHTMSAPVLTRALLSDLPFSCHSHLTGSCLFITPQSRCHRLQEVCLSFDSPGFVTRHPLWAPTASGADFYLNSQHCVCKIGQQRSAPLAWSSSKAGRVFTPVCGHNARHRADHITGTREMLAECRRKPFTNKFCFKCPWHNCVLPLLMSS